MAKQIKPSEAIELCDNFDSKYNDLTTLIGKDDNRSVLFTIKEIRDYLDYVENANAGIDGLRVYFGSYKDTKLSTVFFAPTSSGKDNTELNALNLGEVGMPPKRKYGK